jgi:serine/threonine-protein kinase
VKLVLPDRQDDPLASLLLVREAVVGRRVSSPHVIPILEAQLERGPKFVVMPWLDGASVEDWLETGRHFDLPVVMWIARQTAEGLAALDTAGYSHGDIKPSNLFLDARGHVTLLDLAFARRHDEPAERRDRSITGTGYYLAPEHFSSQSRPDIRSDIYSLGVVLYRLLSGQLPITGRTLGEVARAHKQGAAKPLRSLVPTLPHGVAALVQSMSAKDQLRRPQSPKDLIASLVRLEIQTFRERAA